MIEDMEPPHFMLDNHYMHSNNNNFDIADFLCESGVHPAESRDQCSLSDDSCNRSDCTEGYPGYQGNGDYIDTSSDYCPDNVPYDNDAMTYNCAAERSSCGEDVKIKPMSVRHEQNIRNAQRSQSNGCNGHGIKLEGNLLSINICPKTPLIFSVSYYVFGDFRS